eukprot:m.55243 g.55243  ORF g.55243 m.55243 type:complete len:499 (+) comp12519_c0_seq1:52-1548(+)
MSVRRMLQEMEGEKLKQEQAERERAYAEWQAQQAAELKRLQEEAEKDKQEFLKKQAEMEAEKAKWHVDEEESAQEVARMKKEFLARNAKPKKIKEVFIRDIPTIVIDIGSNTIKCGYAGEDAPRWVFSSVMGRVRSEHMMDLSKHSHVNQDLYVGDEVWVYQDALRIKRVVERGVVQNWDDFREILQHLFFTEMKISKEDLKDHPVMLTEPARNPKANRERLAELLFHELEVPAIYVATTSAMAMFGAGKVTGVVVDIGYGVSSCVAVYDGIIIPHTLRRLDIGGAEVDSYLIRLLNERGTRVNQMSILDSFIARDIKEQLCYVAENYDAEVAKAQQGELETATYDATGHGNDMLPGFEKRTFPDQIQIGTERFQAAEALFHPSLYLGQDVKGIHSMVLDCISSLERSGQRDLIRDMYKNVVLSGGTTLLPGFAERLSRELRLVAPSSVEVNVLATPNRHLATWIGGSRMASSHHFNPNWVSAEEYKEFGADIVFSPQ